MGRPRLFTDTEKRCSRCKAWKLRCEFYALAITSRNPSGLSVACKECEKEREPERKKRWYDAHKSECRASWTQRNRQSKRNIRNQAMASLGNRCANPGCRHLNFDGTLGCDEVDILHVDHIRDDGNAERKTLGDSRRIYRIILTDPNAKSTYQLLCPTCNWRKEIQRRN